MVAYVKGKAKMSPEYMILVLDDFTAHLISSFCDIWDLMQNGNIY